MKFKRRFSEDTNSDSSDEYKEEIHEDNNNDNDNEINEDMYKEDENEVNDSEARVETEPINEEKKLRAWALECQIPHSTLDKLLNILLARLMSSLTCHINATSRLGSTTSELARV